MLVTERRILCQFAVGSPFVIKKSDAVMSRSNPMQNCNKNINKTNKLFKMLDLCRICLSNNKKSLVDLFTTGFFGYDGENYADQLVYCSGVEVKTFFD